MKDPTIHINDRDNFYKQKNTILVMKITDYLQTIEKKLLKSDLQYDRSSFHIQKSKKEIIGKFNEN